MMYSPVLGREGGYKL